MRHEGDIESTKCVKFDVSTRRSTVKTKSDKKLKSEMPGDQAEFIASKTP